MSEDLNLPASLERLEINPERHDSKTEDRLPSGAEGPECSLESLSLNSVCPKGSCQCNKKKESQSPIMCIPEPSLKREKNKIAFLKYLSIGKLIRDRDKGVKRLGNKRPILRRSKLSPAVLRAPILKIPNAHIETPNTQIGTTPTEGPAVIHGTFQNEQNANSTRHSPQEYHDRRAKSQRSNSQNCCAVQARIAAESPSSQTSITPDDTNIDELASYFDLFVHIPKKMSQMAEMMYI